ncbi:putative SOS response-associated peptidase YedK [Pseudomonas sp. GGS8]|uniref:SOS response-associated peptidase family protein n=1 Tax=Pseudomonas sp. GGS8 TaxID=2817892 RepID=UPI0020A16431|nr:SOS response-associated peptidase family protein [Pseudomonas sp. GGS8]MCP1445152.1 putative SOS response-associated peptidase YedK [Pseudomonas sp. GGS8]
MCGRLSQYRGIHDFVAALNIPNALINYAGDQPFELYNAAPSAQLALFHQEGQFLRADMVRWGWRPDWATDCAVPIKARVERVAHNLFFRAIWPHRAISAIDNWFEWVDEGGPKKQPYLIRRKDRAPILCAAIGQYPNAEHKPEEHDGFVFISAGQGGMVDAQDWQPVTLNPELAREWLNPATPKERAEQIMLFQREPTEAFEWFKIDRPMGNVQNQGAHLITPIAGSDEDA